MIANVINASLVIVTIMTVYIASIQYRASHAPMLSVVKVNHKLSQTESFYKVTVKNRGNGVCSDAFLLVKEIKRIKKKGKMGNIKNEYFLSKPTREIYPNSEQEILIHRYNWNINEDVKFMVVYTDFFGRKYLASDTLEGELQKGLGRDNKHMERFAKPAQLLAFWNPKKWLYKSWMKRALKQRNTALGDFERELKSEEQEINEIFGEVAKKDD